MCFQSALSAPDDHLVDKLPGLTEPLHSKTYSGIVSVPARKYHHPWGGRGTSPTVHSYYCFFESERDPANDPIILWLQGGPGGSTLFGGFQEMGPLKLDDRSYTTPEYTASGIPSPIRNEWSWTTFAGLLLLDYADVGFSTCNSTGSFRKRCQWDIDGATEAIVGFLVEFFKMFPEHKGRPLWVAGESFAGNMVTTVSSALDAQGVNSTGVTLAGVLHGNGAVGDYQGAEDVIPDNLENSGPPFNTGDMGPLDVKGHVDFWWRAGLTSTKLYESAIEACPSLGQVKPDKACLSVLAEMQKGIGNFEAMGKGAGWWNVYNIYDTCSDMPHLTQKNDHRSLQQNDDTRPYEHSVSWVCGGIGAMQEYFSRADVQSVLHVARTNKWVFNDDNLKWTHPKEGISFLGEIKRIAEKYPFLVYSGDADAQIPHTSTETWTSSLGFAEVAPYQMWTLGSYVQGYVTQYEHNFTFATVKGAGHMVPLYRPAAAHAMVSRFIETQRLVEASPRREEGGKVVRVISI